MEQTEKTKTPTQTVDNEEQAKKIIMLEKIIAELLKAGEELSFDNSHFEVERWQELSRRIKREMK